MIEKMGRDRGKPLDLEPFRALDTERRALITSAERLKAERNKASEGIARMKKAGEDASAILAVMKEVSDKIKRDDERIGELDEQLKNFLLTIPNIPHASVPVGASAADNVEVRRWGSPPSFDFKARPHWEIGEGAGIL
ncbi:MAG: serine--tRNA ligase, partial [Candidatus Acidiferrales bacterium]